MRCLDCCASLTQTNDDYSRSLCAQCLAKERANPLLITIVRDPRREALEEVAKAAEALREFERRHAGRLVSDRDWMIRVELQPLVTALDAALAKLAEVRRG